MNVNCSNALPNTTPKGYFFVVANKKPFQCGVAVLGVVGPYFVEENNQAVTVDSELCMSILHIFLTNEVLKVRAKVEKHMVSVAWCNIPQAKGSMDLRQCF
jgi:hypothetical protein